MRWSYLGIGCLLLACSCARTVRRPIDLPGVMLWAWQRPEDLRFIDTNSAGVAYLAGTARIRADGISTFEPRLQPLRVKPGTATLAVVRIESAPRHLGVETAPILDSVRRIATTPGIRGVQIDFDARESERAFYLSLLATLQAQLPVPVSVTALASWCEGDRWLEQSAIAEAVPMFFRMGPGEARNMTVASGVCGSSIGLSTDEPWPVHRPATAKRVYLFHPRAWDQDAYRDALQKIGDWK